MITYDSHSWKALIRVKGSVLPSAAFYATLFSLLAAVMKFMELKGFLPVKTLAETVQGSAFNGFTMVLSLMLVFRTNQAYNRFCAGAAHISDFSSELQEMVSAVAAFTAVSSNPHEECQEFLHQLARLCSLLHATVFQVTTEIPGRVFPVMDINALQRSSLTYLQHCRGEERIHVICQWIQVLVLQGMTSGVLNAPAPIVTRVFQALEKSKCSYHQFHQIVKIPFPFPYVQATWILLGVYCVYTPCVMLWWTESSILAFVSTFLCIIGMFCVEITANQLEDPFGDDANDLPVVDFQLQMNSFLLTLLCPQCRTIPALVKDAITDPAELAKLMEEECMAWHSLSRVPQTYSYEGESWVKGEFRERLPQERPSLREESQKQKKKDTGMSELDLACHMEPRDMGVDLHVKRDRLEPNSSLDVDSYSCLQELQRKRNCLDKEVPDLATDINAPPCLQEVKREINCLSRAGEDNDEKFLETLWCAQMLQEQSRIHERFLLELTEIIKSIRVGHLDCEARQLLRM